MILRRGGGETVIPITARNVYRLGPLGVLRKWDVPGVRDVLARSDGSFAIAANERGRSSVHGVVFEDRDGSLRPLSRRRGRLIEMEERGDALWVGYDNGLVRIGADGSISTLGPEQGLEIGGLLLVDREGTLWVGTFRGLGQFPEPDTVGWGDELPETGRWVVRSPEGVTWWVGWTHVLRVTGPPENWSVNDDGLVGARPARSWARTCGRHPACRTSLRLALPVLRCVEGLRCRAVLVRWAFRGFGPSAPRDSSTSERTTSVRDGPGLNPLPGWGRRRIPMRSSRTAAGGSGCRAEARSAAPTRSPSREAPTLSGGAGGAGHRRVARDRRQEDRHVHGGHPRRAVEHPLGARPLGGHADGARHHHGPRERGGSESGQQSGYQAKGAAGADNTWNMDGIPITDMAATGATPTY